jgi:diguanylate cyclase (GGDEF)-like protein
MRTLLNMVLNSTRLKRQNLVLLLLVFFAVVVVVAVALVLTALRAVTVTATALDESRSRQAVSGALSTLQSQMTATMVDYTVWDAAAKAVYSPQPDDWVLQNFDLANAESDIFDTAYLLGPDDQILMAFKRGIPFAVPPSELLSSAFDRMLQSVGSAGTGDDAQASGFVQSADGIAVVGVSTIRAASPEVPVPLDRLQRLVLVYHLDDAKIAEIAETYRIPGLRLIDATSADDNTSAALIHDPAGQVISGLTWTAQSPGDVSYRQARPYVFGAMGLVGGFILLLVLSGSFVIGKLRSDEIAARRMALTDRLSGLSNRMGLSAGLQDMIGQARRSRHNVKLFYLDMDGFKEVNDVYGHATGDQLIIRVAAGLTRLIPHGAILARLGGDEFAIALPLNGAAPAALPLEAVILDFFSEPFTIGELVVVVGISVGTAISTLGSVDAEELLRRADIAMYRAKAEGRGRAIAYNGEMDRALAERKAMETALRAGIQDQEFSVVYQPVVDARTGAIVGLEALLRWNSARLGLVSPEVFIPLAESSGLIDRLGLFVMREALRVARAWPQIGISINISPAQFRNPFFIPNVTQLLEASGVPPASVTLEVTEGYFIHNPGHARKAIEALNGLGVRIALDDFGAGFSSIGYLRQFGFDRLKLDRSMITALEDIQRGREMLQATLTLAAALDIPVTAEGIETEEQAIFLKLCGCDQLQGYFFFQPAAEAELGILLAESVVLEAASPSA